MKSVNYSIVPRVLLVVLIAAAVSALFLVGNASAQTTDDPGDGCLLIFTFEDGRRLMLCPPLASEPAPSPEPSATQVAPTEPPAPTATSQPEPTATAVAGPVDPYPEAPLCADHDPRAFHTLWNRDEGCHYDHHHGDDPHTVDDIFGTQYYQWAGGEISYPWQTGSSSTCLENDCKHTGYVWLVRRDQACDSQFTAGCVTAFRAVAHAMSTSNSASVRYHSAWLEALVCKESEPDNCGIFRSGGWQDTGDLMIDGETAIDVPNNNNRVKLHYVDTGNPQFGTWYSGSPGGEEQRGGLFSVTVELGDLWGPLDPSDPTQVQYFCEDPTDMCKHNGSRYQPHVIGVAFPPRFRAALDPDRDQVANFDGYVDRWGELVQGCSSVGLDCIPLVIEDVSMEVMYQGRFGYREYDITFDNQTSGWIQPPY